MGVLDAYEVRPKNAHTPRKRVTERGQEEDTVNPRRREAGAGGSWPVLITWMMRFVDAIAFSHFSRHDCRTRTVQDTAGLPRHTPQWPVGFGGGEMVGNTWALREGEKRKLEKTAGSREKYE